MNNTTNNHLSPLVISLESFVVKHEITNKFACPLAKHNGVEIRGQSMHAQVHSRTNTTESQKITTKVNTNRKPKNPVQQIHESIIPL
jgi:hypothetical protein